MTDERRPQVSFKRLPPVPPSGIGELDAASAEYQALLRRHQAALGRLRDLRAGRSGAEAADLRAAAQAARADEPDPGNAAVATLEAEVTATIREADVIATAINAAGAELIALFGVHQPALREHYLAAGEKSRAKLARTLDRVEADAAEVVELSGALGIAESWPNVGGHREPALTIPRADRPVPLRDVLAALRTLGEPPAEPELPEMVDKGDAMTILGVTSHRRFEDLVRAGRVQVEHVPAGFTDSGTRLSVPRYRTAGLLALGGELRRERYERQTADSAA